MEWGQSLVVYNGSYRGTDTPNKQLNDSVKDSIFYHAVPDFCGLPVKKEETKYGAYQLNIMSRAHCLPPEWGNMDAMAKQTCIFNHCKRKFRPRKDIGDLKLADIRDFILNLIYCMHRGILPDFYESKEQRLKQMQLYRPLPSYNGRYKGSDTPPPIIQERWTRKVKYYTFSAPAKGQTGNRKGIYGTFSLDCMSLPYTVPDNWTKMSPKEKAENVFAFCKQHLKPAKKFLNLDMVRDCLLDVIFNGHRKQWPKIKPVHSDTVLPTLPHQPGGHNPRLQQAYVDLSQQNRYCGPGYSESMEHSVSRPEYRGTGRGPYDDADLYSRTERGPGVFDSYENPIRDMGHRQPVSPFGDILYGESCFSARDLPLRQSDSPLRSMPFRRSGSPFRNVPYRQSGSPPRNIPYRRSDSPQMDMPYMRSDSPQMDMPYRRSVSPYSDRPYRRSVSPHSDMPYRRFDSPQMEMPHRRSDSPQMDMPFRRFDSPHSDMPYRRSESPHSDMPYKQSDSLERDVPFWRSDAPQETQLKTLTSNDLQLMAKWESDCTVWFDTPLKDVPYRGSDTPERDLPAETFKSVHYVVNPQLPAKYKGSSMYGVYQLDCMKSAIALPEAWKDWSAQEKKKSVMPLVVQKMKRNSKVNGQVAADCMLDLIYYLHRGLPPNLEPVSPSTKLVPSSSKIQHVIPPNIKPLPPAKQDLPLDVPLIKIPISQSFPWNIQGDVAPSKTPVLYPSPLRTRGDVAPSKEPVAHFSPMKTLYDVAQSKELLSHPSLMKVLKVEPSRVELEASDNNSVATSSSEDDVLYDLWKEMEAAQVYPNSDKLGLPPGGDVEMGTTPVDLDTDKKGLSPDGDVGKEMGATSIDPDTDKVGLSPDGDVEMGATPVDPDTDKEGLIPDGDVEMGTTLVDSDTDKQGLLPDGDVEMRTTLVDPNTDKEGLTSDGDVGKEIGATPIVCDVVTEEGVSHQDSQPQKDVDETHDRSEDDTGSKEKREVYITPGGRHDDVTGLNKEEQGKILDTSGGIDDGEAGPHMANQKVIAIPGGIDDGEADPHIENQEVLATSGGIDDGEAKPNKEDQEVIATSGGIDDGEAEPNKEDQEVLATSGGCHDRDIVPNKEDKKILAIPDDSHDGGTRLKNNDHGEVHLTTGGRVDGETEPKNEGRREVHPTPGGSDDGDIEPKNEDQGEAHPTLGGISASQMKRLSESASAATSATATIGQSSTRSTDASTTTTVASYQPSTQDTHNPQVSYISKCLIRTFSYF